MLDLYEQSKRRLKMGDNLKNKSKLKQFVVVTWSQDEGGGLSPISLPVKAKDKKEIEIAINEEKEKLNGSTLPNKDMFLSDYASNKFNGKIYDLEKWLNLKLKYLDFDDTEESDESVEPFKEADMKTFPADPNFDKLKDLFLNKLNEIQRATVFDNLEIVPGPSIKTIPKLLSVIALNTMREQGELKKAWDEVMKLVPSELQSPNPF